MNNRATAIYIMLRMKNEKFKQNKTLSLGSLGRRLSLFLFGSGGGVCRRRGGGSRRMSVFKGSAEESITSVTHAGKNEAVFRKVCIHCCDVDFDLGVKLLETSNASCNFTIYIIKY